jgi:hypothetical protein
LFPTGHVARRLIVDENGPYQVRRVPEDIVSPMRNERVPLPAWERRHGSRVRVALMFEENWEVSLYYVTQHRDGSSASSIPFGL